MAAVGIVAEYNPFHNGHLYHLMETKRRFPDHVVICVMSGNFVQRGEPALLPKNVRAAMAAECGADLVF
ncbi:MAG: nucleotidyltransferase family protein, partial [Clostridia bacterium]|nr:nucleotidyltransferase family protein [Clostridia bacterium]